MSKFARRVDQLDAVYLDEELFALLNSHYRQAFKYLPSSLYARLGQELDILFKFCFKYLPLQSLGSTFGQSLFRLQYYNTTKNEMATKNELLILSILAVCVPWFWQRVLQKCLLKLPYPEANLNIISMSYKLEKNFSLIYNIITMINFCIFLQKSTFPSVIERLLHLKPVYSAPQELHRVMDDNIYRELLWYGLSEFLGFALPLINVHKLKGILKRSLFVRSYRYLHSRHHHHNFECLICKSIPNFPYTIGCSHAFCYYCIASMVLADPYYLCYQCDVKANGLENIKPLSANRNIE